MAYLWDAHISTEEDLGSKLPYSKEQPVSKFGTVSRKQHQTKANQKKRKAIFFGENEESFILYLNVILGYI